MRMRWLVVIIIGCLLIAVVLVPKLLIQVAIRSSGGIVKQTKLAHMELIKEGIIAYSKDHSCFPSNLEEVVRAGKLPAVSKIYWNPLKHNSPEERAISYMDCEFDLVWSSTGVVISLPKGTNSNEWADLQPFWKQSIVWPLVQSNRVAADKS